MKPIRVARISASWSSLICETSTSLSMNWPDGRPIEAAEQIEQRALAGAGRAHDRDVIALRHVERHAAQRVDRLSAEHVVLAEIGDADGQPHSGGSLAQSLAAAVRPAAGARPRHPRFAAGAAAAAADRPGRCRPAHRLGRLRWPPVSAAAAPVRRPPCRSRRVRPSPVAAPPAAPLPATASAGSTWSRYARGFIATRSPSLSPLSIDEELVVRRARLHSRALPICPGRTRSNRTCRRARTSPAPAPAARSALRHSGS